jgi:hypothetical protein
MLLDFLSSVREPPFREQWCDNGCVEIDGEPVELQTIGNLGDDVGEGEEFDGQRPLGRLSDHQRRPR